MWIEASLTKEDLVDLARKLAPVEIRLGDKGGVLRIADPREIYLLPTVGLHIECSGHLEWPVLGVKVPVTFHSIRMRVRPDIDKRETGDALAFKLEIEHADMAIVPDLVDNTITDVINRELSKKEFSLAWDFTSMLTNVFQLPDAFVNPRTLGLTVVGGHVRVAEDALVLAVSFEAQVARTVVAKVDTHAEVRA